jgi:hypothetical protein
MSTKRRELDYRYSVVVSYKAYPDPDYDAQVERVAGRYADGSGYGLFDGGRDLVFDYKLKGPALAMETKLRRKLKKGLKGVKGSIKHNIESLPAVKRVKIVFNDDSYLWEDEN